MTTLREAAQMVLDAIETIPEDIEGYLPEPITDAVIAFRAALTQPEPEPVAWLYTNKLGGRQVSLIEPPADMKDQYQPLYLVPPQANNFNPD